MRETTVSKVFLSVLLAASWFMPMEASATTEKKAAEPALHSYVIDNAHTSINFRVRHLVSKTRGRFDKFKGTVAYDEKKIENSKVDVEIETESINTDNKKRDDHLKSADFFDADKYPTMKFVSTKITGKKKMKVQGNLTIRDVTKPVTLDVEFGGAVTDPWGTKKLGFSASTKINRKDFGISWNKTLDAGGLVLGDDVEITIDGEADLKEEKKSE